MQTKRSPTARVPGSSLAPRLARRRSRLGPFPSAWRARIVPTLARIGTGLGFAAVPALSARFGDPTVLFVAFVMAAAVAMLVYFAWKMLALEVAGLLVPDLTALVLLVPVLIVASGIEAADKRLSGSGPHALMAALAVLGVLLLVALAAAVANDGYMRQATLALLPAALSVAAIVGGEERFAAGRLPSGLSAAWMIAALATLVDGITPREWRRALPIGFYVVFAAVVLLARDTGSAGGTDQASAAVAVLAAVAAGGILLAAPRIASAIGIEE